MKILYLGDIVGADTILTISKYIKDIKKEYNVNIVLANGENVSGGVGLIKKDYIELQKAGISALSMGNHTYSKKEIYEFVEEANIAVPANLPGAVGKKYLTFKYNDKTITIINLLGRVFMNNLVDCPFKTMDKLLEEIKSDYILVDIHAEATSEKKALLYYLKDRVDVLVGTHTHIQTSDEGVFGKTLYITDLGMCGPKDSIIGDDIDLIVERFTTGLHRPIKVAKGQIELNGVILDLKERSIRRFNKVYE